MHPDTVVNTRVGLRQQPSAFEWPLCELPVWELVAVASYLLWVNLHPQCSLITCLDLISRGYQSSLGQSPVLALDFLS